MQKLKAAREALKGKKTYILGSLAVITVVLEVLGVIEGEAATTILGALGAGGLLSVRAAISKTSQK